MTTASPMPAGKPASSRLQDWLAWGAARLGWPGLLGLGLLAASLALCLLAVKPMETRAQALETRAQDQVRQQALKPDIHTAPVQDWRSNLPADRQAYARLARLFEAAETAGLALDEGNYRTQTETRSGLVRRVVILPVAGTYPALRSFMAEALNQDAALALEGLRMSRETLETPDLEAELRLAYYLEARP
ncbi:MAG: hypothetical protein AB1421_15655 [Pseudomonadota bacterium]|jgi:hypothetical protein